VTNYSETRADIEPEQSPREPALGLRMLAKACNVSGCPTIYQTDRGTLVIQGYAVAADRAGIDLPAGELLVEIPVDLLTQAVNTAN
jgi:hypothetical protein